VYFSRACRNINRADNFLATDITGALDLLRTFGAFGCVLSVTRTVVNLMHVCISMNGNAIGGDEWTREYAHENKGQIFFGHKNVPTKIHEPL
jgi:hypothetical protein